MTILAADPLAEVCSPIAAGSAVDFVAAILSALTQQRARHVLFASWYSRASVASADALEMRASRAGRGSTVHKPAPVYGRVSVHPTAGPYDR